MTKKDAINNAAQMLAIAAKLSTDKDGNPIHTFVSPGYALELAEKSVEKLLAVG